MSIVKQGARLPVINPNTIQNVSISGTTARTAADFQTDTEVIRIVATTDCWYKLGDATVDATTSDIFLPGGVVEIISVKKGVQTRIAVIQNSASGILNVVEVD